MSRDWFSNPYQYKEAVLAPRVLINDPYIGMARVYPNGKTQPGWGAKEFMDNLTLGKFRVSRAAKFHTEYGWPFGLIMRSIPYVCIDIDGKNGGIDMAHTMDLPPTLAETSKSGNGFHLFYSTPQDTWNKNLGYNGIDDIIGLVPGIDIKATGLVYHYPQQRWNNLDPAPLPDQLVRMLSRRTESRRITRITARGTHGLDADDLAIVHDGLRRELATRFGEGSRNNKLFAIAAKMAAADYPHWDLAVFERGTEIGLEASEIKELIANVEKYA